MQGYWIRFEDGSEGYCQGQNPFDAVQIAEHLTGKKVDHEGSQWDPKLRTLPYPAAPVIWQLEHPVYGKTPTFCHNPRGCAGKTSCPRERACDD